MWCQNYANAVLVLSQKLSVNPGIRVHQLIAINCQLIGDPDQTIKFAIIFYQPIILIANQLIDN